ncbi:MAG: hypothetical protein O6948_04490, partial [Deltaproteobacteria bacterium]|nr:hypothetical protein [Deltaproteobacteria bacterium]
APEGRCGRSDTDRGHPLKYGIRQPPPWRRLYVNVEAMDGTIGNPFASYQALQLHNGTQTVV